LPDEIKNYDEAFLTGTAAEITGDGTNKDQLDEST